MVATLHSFVGIAATIVGFANYGKMYGWNAGPETIGKGEAGTMNLVETYIAVWFGALTFTGSVVAAGKLNENIRSEPLILWGNFRHWLNLFIILITIVLLFFFIKT